MLEGAEVYLWAYSIYACKVQMPNSRRQLCPTIVASCEREVCVWFEQAHISVFIIQFPWQGYVASNSGVLSADTTQAGVGVT